MKTPTTASILRAALARGRTIAKSHNVVGVGLGWKHSQGQGYGARSRPTVKFFVNEKRTDLARADQLPKSISVRCGGTLKRVSTDVESLGEFRRNGVPVCKVGSDDRSGPEGTPGFVVVDPSGTKFLITAGHVLAGFSSSGRWPSKPQGVHVDTELVGRVVQEHTYYVDQSLDMVFDVGLVLLERVPLAMRQPPWTEIKRVLPTRSLIRSLAGNLPPIYGVQHGWKARPLVRVDAVDWDGLPVKQETYAPVMLHLRALDGGEFVSGNSGAPIVSQLDGTLIGMHVLGKVGEPSTGWAISAASILASLSQRIGARLDVASTQPLSA